jgi:hypothetical protein
MATYRRSAAVVALVLGFLLSTQGPGASGPVGLYGIVQRVVFEPTDTAPERVQVWGAFAYVDGASTSTSGQISPIRVGYLYFRMPDDAGLRPVVAREWADLKAVAGTGEAVGFGTWGYIGAFAGLDPAGASGRPPYILEMYPGRGVSTDMRVRPAGSAPSTPAVYQTNTGMVKLSPIGSRAEVVRKLREALGTK